MTMRNLLLLCLPGLSPTFAPAETPAEKGLAIAVEADARDRGFGDSTAGMEMVNHQTGKSTTLSWEEYRFRTGLTDRDFDQNSLKRAK
jgi:hypothetical protein